MSKVILEYIYIDGYTSPIVTGSKEEAPNANVRSKTKIVDNASLKYHTIPTPESLPLWN